MPGVLSNVLAVGDDVQFRVQATNLRNALVLAVIFPHGLDAHPDEQIEVDHLILAVIFRAQVLEVLAVEIALFMGGAFHPPGVVRPLIPVNLELQSDMRGGLLLPLVRVLIFAFVLVLRVVLRFLDDSR